MSKELIPHKDFVYEAENLENGEQINVNHTNCPAGEDIKQRLYIKRTDDGRNILAYCHNCGLHGWHGSSTQTAKSCGVRFDALCGTGEEAAKGRYRSNRSTGSLPRDFTIDKGEWGARQHAWVTKYGITEEETRRYRVGYSPSGNSIVLPVYRGGELVGYQERNWDEGQPKYTTRTTEKPLWWYSGDYIAPSATLPSLTTLTLTEDMLSGIKCARYTPTIALLGAVAGDKVVAFIIDKCSDMQNIVIFLDDDNRQVKLNQLKIKVKLEQLGRNVKLITGINKDPKQCSDAELQEILLC